MTAVNQLNSALAGRYSVEREIGAGGMAIVYLAKDIKHHRNVALKVLNPELGAVLGVERFLSEIQVTANLQHPNLLPLFDSGEAEGLLFYVMPFIEGESLRKKLDKHKQLPVNEAIHIAVAVAGALDYAHQHGVIHRDLKPENVLLQSGEPVVADFGIALAVSNAGGQRVTQTGISLGTPHYMSPEQATGDRQIDGRTDIYSLGALLYEMLSGEPPHTGSTAQAIIARLLTDKPRPVRTVRNTVPEHVDAAIERALAKLPADRFDTAHEFAQALTGQHSVAVPVGRLTSGSPQRDLQVSFTIPTRHLRKLVMPAALVLLAAFALWGWLRGGIAGRGTETTVRFTLVLPAEQRIAEGVLGAVFAVSPNGRHIAYLASDALGIGQMYVRAMDQLKPQVIDGSRNARNIAFSPDGQWIAFATGLDVKKVAVEGGPVIKLASLRQSPAGMSWGVPETIVVGGVSVLAIPAVGGTPREVATTSATSSEIAYRWPLALPDGKTVLYTSWSNAGVQGATLASMSLETGESTPLGLPGSSPLRVVDGLLLYGASTGAIMAVPFNGGRLEGNPVPVAQDVIMDPSGALKASLSATGTLAYLSGLSVTQPMLLSARGEGSVVVEDPRPYSTPRFSPNGERIAFTIATSQGFDVWVYDTPKGTLTRLTNEGSNLRPEWTSDGARILFRSERQTGVGVWWQAADGSGPAERLYQSDEDYLEAILSPDGKSLIYRTAPTSKFSRDIFYVNLEGSDRTPKPLVVSPHQDMMPRLSPDGRWMVYQSDESGQFEIYVRPFPNAGARVQVSTSGGWEPIWSRDGRTLFYKTAGRIVAAAVRTSTTFSMGNRTTALVGDFVPNPTHANWDVAPDGKHFLVMKRAGGEAQAIVVHNWMPEVRARTAAKR